MEGEEWALLQGIKKQRRLSGIAIEGDVGALVASLVCQVLAGIKAAVPQSKEASAAQREIKAGQLSPAP